MGGIVYEMRKKNMQVDFSLESLSKHEWHDLNAVIKHMTKCYILYNSEIKVFKNSRISWYDIYYITIHFKYYSNIYLGTKIKSYMVAPNIILILVMYHSIFIHIL